MIPDPAAYLRERFDNSGIEFHRAELRTVFEDPEEAEYSGNGKGEDMLLLLRALSQTCSHLRAFPLLCSGLRSTSLIWDELGRLNEYLEMAPSVAPLIHDFSFMWSMNGDHDKLEPYLEKHGSLLDMAFIDRGALWDRTREELDGKIELEHMRAFSGPGSRGGAFFTSQAENGIS